MKAFKIVIGILLVVVCVVLIIALYKTYQDMNFANEYIEYVTDSTNNIIANVDEIHLTLNEIHFKNGEEHLNELERELNDFSGLLDTIDQQRKINDLPYQSESVDETFTEYLKQSRKVSDTFSEIINSIKNLEEKDDFNLAVQDYIDEADILKQQSTQIQNVLYEYAENYKKIDVERLLYGISLI